MAIISERRPKLRIRWKSKGKGIRVPRWPQLRENGNRPRQYLRGKLRLFFVNDQRRREANRRRTGTQHQQTMPETLEDDRITKSGCYDLDTDHQTSTPDIRNDFALILQMLELISQELADSCGI